MSVINKMLRDLDHRQAAQVPVGGQSAVSTTVQPAVHHGTASVPYAPFGAAASARAHARRWIWLGALLAVVAVALGGAYWVQNGGILPTAAVITPAPVAPPVVAVSAPVAAPAIAAASPAASEPVTEPTVPDAVAAHAAPGAMVLRMETSLSARKALDALLSSTPAPAPTPAPVAASAPAIATQAPERTKTRAVASAPVPAPAPVAAATAVASRESAPVLQRQQQAGVDAVAQAQNLWNTGSRDAAMDLMQQSIAVAERAAKVAGASGANPVLLPLVREMARMQLAEARYGAVWEMLTRLEPQLGNQPDLWAIRANAAQRLGRHPDSVHAYMMALQSRPDEQRWLLGTAVSLAALGQTTSAAEMAEKARAVGPVSKDILAYLRQAGVPLRE